MAFCGLCGKEISEGQTFCRECNNNLACPQPEKQFVPKKSKGSPASIICFIAAGLTFILCLFGGIQMLTGAENISRLAYVSGNTVTEIFYNNCGTVFRGLGLFVIACGIFAGTFLTYYGYKNIKK
ncbi:MAG: hypothetical protein HFE66_08070 [Clostridiales bacterium]|nr:hypothetical protein [Clostridiales bacterium]